MKNSTLPNLPHIKGEHLKTIADAFFCHSSYVWKIVKGERKANSDTARAILRAAKKLNSTIEKANGKIKTTAAAVNQELETE